MTVENTQSTEQSQQEQVMRLRGGGNTVADCLAYKTPLFSWYVEYLTDG